VKRFSIVGGGEIGLPAELAERWNTHSVALDDEGDHLVIRPVAESSELPDDDWVEVDTPEAVRRGGSGVGY
jgi:virulence-associated protein VagC